MLSQASVNRVLSGNLNGRLRATLVSFTGGALCLLAESTVWMFSVDPKLSDDFTVDGCQWWMFTGGLFGVVTVSMNIYLPQKIGHTANFIFQILGGISFSLLLDLLGAFGLTQRAVSLSRVGGIVLTLGGALFVTNSKKSQKVIETQHCDLEIPEVVKNGIESVALTEYDIISPKGPLSVPQSLNKELPT